MGRREVDSCCSGHGEVGAVVNTVMNLRVR